MTATITLADRRLPLPIHDEALLRRIVAAVANKTGEQFRAPRPAPSVHARRVETVFTTGQVEAINADGVDFADLPSPVSTVEAVAA